MRTLKWLIWSTLIYYMIVFTDMAFLGIIPFEVAQMFWAIIVTMPFWNRKVGTYCGTNWFK